jgi:hypothetical protein
MYYIKMDSNITDEHKIIIYYEQIEEYKLSILRSIIWIIIYIICLRIANDNVSYKIFLILLIGEGIMILLSRYKLCQATDKKIKAESRIKNSKRILNQV